jgi:hypothetical protein
MSEMRRNPKLSIPVGVTLLVLRGLLLWLVVPVGLLCWVPLLPLLLRRGIKLGAFLGWLDLNLVAFLERTLLRAVVSDPEAWTPVREMAHVTHRIRLVDPV